MSFLFILDGCDFICKSIETIDQDDFFETWKTLNGEEVNFYPLPKG